MLLQAHFLILLKLHQLVLLYLQPQSNINGTLGVGAANSNAQMRIQGSGTSQPFFEVDNCLGNGSTSTSTYANFGGFVGIHISSVGSMATGTYYIKLWS